ncbi:hypothetical protein OF83DRAFT_1177323 [Amylostereum chailletii]|nr:hypothetical protein OF83DRAFT_1177323 [Amylostereum chailletii]
MAPPPLPHLVHDQNVQPGLPHILHHPNGLFIDPMLGTPLAIYIQKDVEDRQTLTDLVEASPFLVFPPSMAVGFREVLMRSATELVVRYMPPFLSIALVPPLSVCFLTSCFYQRNGGTIATGYSGIPYILVDPYKESGQNMFRQYAGKKNKIILSAQWIHECIKLGFLQTFQHNWAGCRVTGNEEVVRESPQGDPPTDADSLDPPNPLAPVHHDPPGPDVMPPFLNHPPSHMPGPPPDGMHDHSSYGFHPYPPPFAHHPPPPHDMPPPEGGPPQTWQSSNGMPPEHVHLPPSHMVPPPPPGWPFPPPVMPAPGHEFEYHEENTEWVRGPPPPPPPPPGFFPPHPFQFDPAYVSPPTPEAGPSTLHSPIVDREDSPPRGRKRSRLQYGPAPPPSTLVANRSNAQKRSPTPPTRVVKSTYGGNLFTADDVLYLKKYIEFCQEQGLVLSLREICERVAIKAPHHTFYSWRRYCNKHHIRLGGYSMVNEENPDNQGDIVEHADNMDNFDGNVNIRAGANQHAGPGVIAVAKARIRAEAAAGRSRSRSPSPPRALFRSTTGKGVAFTDEDVTYLIRLLSYRKIHGKIPDMPSFWKEISSKAPHHSRASWMKFYRRHKHELNHGEGDEPLPHAPEKKMRYSLQDDILLAKFFFSRPLGTSDKQFQQFGRQHPHHPWKGWQEHHRIHKTKIDHLVTRLLNGESLDDVEDADDG